MSREYLVCDDTGLVTQIIHSQDIRDNGPTVDLDTGRIIPSVRDVYNFTVLQFFEEPKKITDTTWVELIDEAKGLEDAHGNQ